MRITVGTYKNTKYTFNNASRRITVYGFPWKFDLDTIKLITNNTGLGNSNIGYVLAAPSLSKCTVAYASPSTTVTVGTATSGGAVTAGTHSYVVTYVYDTGDESLASTASSVITVVGGTQTVPLTNIPIGATGVIQRNIYRTVAGNTGSYLLLTSIADNSTTTFSDTIADASLGVTAPTTSNAYNIDYSAPVATLATGDKLLIDVEIPDPIRDDSLDILKVIPQVMAELPPADTQVGINTDTNLATGVYYYDIPATGWRNFIAQIKATCSTSSSIFKIFATLDPSVAVTATNASPSVDWVDITNTIFGQSQITVPTTGTYISPILNWNIDDNGMQAMYERFMVQYTVANATNFWNMNVKQF